MTDNSDNLTPISIGDDLIINLYWDDADSNITRIYVCERNLVKLSKIHDFVKSAIIVNFTKNLCYIICLI